MIELQNISKTYPGVVALENVSFRMEPGEVHALMGENGAGKSTLIKILAGAIGPTHGQLEVSGHAYSGLTPKRAGELGISVIYQEFNLIPYLTVAENVFLGNEIKARGIFADKKAMKAKTKELLNRLGIEIDPDARVKDLSVAYQQMVEIAKALSRQCKILIMDEPSAPLSRNEVDKLFDVVRLLKKQGVLVVYVSHRMDEIFQISDRITVLRDGRHVATKPTSELSRPELIRLMVGRELNETFPSASEKDLGKTVLETRGLSNGSVSNVSFELKEGEILGLFGLIGSGRTELARALFGADPVTSGTLRIHGAEANVRTPGDAIERRIALIPEDRKQHGLLLELSVGNNMTFAGLPQLARFGFIQGRKEKQVVRTFLDRLQVRTPGSGQKVKHLSGGNQQKVVLSKWLSTSCNILIFDEPTRGIDIGAKQEIYMLMRELANRGAAILMISSEMPELLGMADRILVMRGGSIVGECGKEQFSQEALMTLAAY
ncbi:sugar ABC transporter ATP-binding protein [Paenibacillaceae bacterium WGS1546]|uniref:sugar ABC transporter ATP-binding protein n=1 Tax=Cohnella sp. WGS1546 TaxID=3366810 RepID=UPI00372D434B